MKIAISSGHTESVALAYGDGVALSENGSTLVVNRSTSLHIHCLSDAEDVRPSKRLGEILASLLQNLSPTCRERGFKHEDRLALSLPGVATIWDREVGEKCVRDAGWPATETNPPNSNFCVVDDTYAGLIAGSLSTKGICAFAGTGASVYMGTPDGSSRPYTIGPPDKLDGFGPLLGDHGSAFRLAMTTLERICREFDNVHKVVDPPADGRGCHGLPILFDKLRRTMEEGYKLRRKMEKGYPRESEARVLLQIWFDELLANLTPDWRFQIAELAKVITEAADAGDPFAQEMVSEAAGGMAQTLTIALNHEDFAEMHSAPIYCQGGMFRYSPFYLKRVTDLLNQSGKNNDVALARYRPCVGALLIAASPNWIVPNDRAIVEIQDAIDAIPSDDRHLVFNRP